MAKVRKQVLKFTLTGSILVDLKDSKSVLSASKTIEALQAEAAAHGVLLIEVKEAFGNADIEEAPADAGKKEAAE